MKQQRKRRKARNADIMLRIDPDLRRQLGVLSESWRGLPLIQCVRVLVQAEIERSEQ